MIYTQQEINNFYSKYSCCFASLATDYTNSLAIGAFDCGQKLDKLLQFKSYLDILYCYKVDTCIIDQPEINSYSVSIYFPLEGDDTTEYSFYKNGVLISGTYTNEDVVNYFLNLGFGSIGQVPFINPSFIDSPTGWEAGNYNSNIQNLYTINTSLYYQLSDTTSAPISAEFFNPEFSEEVANAYAITGTTEDTYTLVQNSNEATGEVVFLKLIIVNETCVEYTEEELNCITNEDLDTLLFWMKQQCLNIKNKPTITEVECVEVSENEFSISINDSITIEAGDSIEVSRNGNVYTITNPLPDLEVTIKAGNNIVVTGTYPNFTISSTGGGGGGATNLSYTASPTNGVVNSDTGTDATIPLASGTNAGLMAPTQFTKLSNINVTQVVDLDTIESDTVTNNAKVSNATHTGDVTGATALTVDKTAITSKAAVTPVGADYILISDTSDSGNLKKSLISDLPGGGGGGGVASVTAGTNISVTGTSANPIINSLSDRYKTTSTSTNTINNNNGKVFTVDANLAYIPLQEVLIVNSLTNYHMHGTVFSYNSTTGSLVVDINSHTGTGTYSSWVINLDGTPVDAITGVGTANQIAYFTAGQVIASVAAGANGQVLGLSGGLPTWSTSKGAFGVTFDGQGGVVSVGKTDWVSIPYNCTITGWEIFGDAIGSCVIDIWKSTYATFPPIAPGIAVSGKPTLATARTNGDLTLSPAWAAVTAGDCIMFYVESCSTLTKINLIVYTNIII